jgi:NAD(P)-dependent dehydrogenase (short-subunit alcohol dehydrogenase family)
MQLRLDDKVTLIAFKGNTWLADIAVSFAEAGANVAIVGDEVEKVNDTVMMLKNKGYEILGLPTQTDRTEAVNKAFRKAVDHYGRIDILVNNFNAEITKPLLTMSEEEWHQILAANLTSAIYCCKSAGQYMVKQHAGSIINIISGLAERGLINATGYCAALGGVLQLTRALALEWAKMNVRVNAIGIGWKETDGTPGQKDPVKSYIPSKRRARPDDITPMVLFLASEASSYLNGNVYYVDGGLMARG